MLFCKLVEPITYKLEKLVLLNIVFVVALILLIPRLMLVKFNAVEVEKEFKLLNIVVDVAFKLFMLNCPLVEN